MPQPTVLCSDLSFSPGRTARASSTVSTSPSRADAPASSAPTAVASRPCGCSPVSLRPLRGSVSVVGLSAYLPSGSTPSSPTGSTSSSVSPGHVGRCAASSTVTSTRSCTTSSGRTGTSRSASWRWPSSGSATSTSTARSTPSPVVSGSSLPSVPGCSAVPTSCFSTNRRTTSTVGPGASHRRRGGVSGVLIVVSHDRELLEHVDPGRRAAFGPVRIVGGTYSAYLGVVGRSRRPPSNGCGPRMPRSVGERRDLREQVTKQARRDRYGRLDAKRSGMPKMMADARKRGPRRRRTDRGCP